MHMVLARLRHRHAAAAATARKPRSGGITDAFRARLPFALTAGQCDVIQTNVRYLSRSQPMHRLLQGDVGSGKTIVALLAMLQVVDAGGQAALLAPTEVLAVQHHRSISLMLGDLGRAGMLGAADQATGVELLTGAMPAGQRRQVLSRMAEGQAGIVIGTHALIQDGVEFADLGLLVIDEQHRFGVEQRAALADRQASNPHVLVMTATPTPRAAPDAVLCRRAVPT